MKKILIPLEKEIRTHISTDECAFFLCLKSQTLRSWGCESMDYDSPIKPIKVGNKLLWAVKDIKKILGLTECNEK